VKKAANSRRNLVLPTFLYSAESEEKKERNEREVQRSSIHSVVLVCSVIALVDSIISYIVDIEQKSETMLSVWRSKLLLLFAWYLVCIHCFSVRHPIWRNIRLRAAAADDADNINNEKGKNTSGNDNEEEPPLKMPRAMIKPTTDENLQSSPPEQFDSGIGSKNKPSRKSMSSRAAAVAASSKEPGGVGSVKNNWKVGILSASLFYTSHIYILKHYCMSVC
jgi:hypothetical protein